jgi:transcriptional regulator with XRE-family HTH domain
MKKVVIGKKIREIRKNQKYSLKDLSRLSQCSVNYLSQLERGLNSPTIETLIRITEALGVQLVDFFSEKDAGDSPWVIRKKDRKSFSREMAGVSYEKLSSLEDKALLDSFLIKLKPGAMIGNTAHEQKGVEFLYVLSGTLDLTFNGQIYKLFPMDSVCFNSGELHQLGNSGPKPTEVISVSSPPRF